MKLKAISSLALAAITLTAPMAADAFPLFPVFTFRPGPGLQGSIPAYIPSFQANDIGGQYRETFTFVNATDFTVSLLFMGNIMSYDDTVTPKTYLPFESGLGSNYQIYALETASGKYTGGPSTPITFTVTSGTFTMYLDPFANSGMLTTFPGNAPNGTTPYARTNDADDIVLARGVLLSPSVGIETCTGGNNCGSFGQTSTFVLEPPGLTNPIGGAGYFISPAPFFRIALTSGQFEGVNPVIGQEAFSTGTANIVFAVPEPSILGLAGLGLVALGCSRRRREQA